MASKFPNGYGLGGISPNYYLNHDEFPNKVLTIKSGEIDKILDNDIETKILVYEDRVKGWFLDFARKLTKERNSEFVVLMICMNYLEGNQQFREGRVSSNWESTEMLKRALKRIFPDNSEEEIDFLIDKVRHGLFHDGMTRRGAVLRYGLSIPFFFFTVNDEKWIEIEPDLFLRNIEKDFESYIQILKDKNNKKERENFEKHYIERYETKSRKRQGRRN